MKTTEHASASAGIPNPIQTETSVSHDAPASDDVPGAKRVCIRESPESAISEENPLTPQEFREQVDLVAEKHGPNFLKLNPENRQWLLKIHRN